jgi:hypothetical protein
MAGVGGRLPGRGVESKKHATSGGNMIIKKKE